MRLMRVRFRERGREEEMRMMVAVRTEEEWRREAEEEEKGMSRGLERSGECWSLVDGVRRKGRRRREEEVGSGKEISARVPDMERVSGFMPKATQPEGEMKVPVKVKSRVELWG